MDNEAAGTAAVETATVSSAPVAESSAPSASSSSGGTTGGIETSTSTSTASESFSASTETASGGGGSSEKPDGYIASGPAKEGRALTLVQDPMTGKRIVKFVTVGEQQGAEVEEEAQQAGTAQAGFPAMTDDISRAAEAAMAEAPRYTLDELSMAIATGNIDERRVPEAYKQQVADYKIRRAVEAYNRQLAQAAKQQQANVNRQLDPKVQAQAMRDFYKKLDDSAKERAMKDLNLTAEQLDDLEYSDDNTGTAESYKAAYEWHRQQLINGIQQQASRDQQARMAQQNVYKGITDFVRDAQGKEPNFAAIDRMMLTRYQELPYGEARPVEDAIIALRNGNITIAQTETLRKYYDNCRKEYYAKKNNLGTTPQTVNKKPPVVERSGSGKSLPRDVAANYNDLRNARSVKERRAWLQNFFSQNKHS